MSVPAQCGTRQPRLCASIKTLPAGQAMMLPAPNSRTSAPSLGPQPASLPKRPPMRGRVPGSPSPDSREMTTASAGFMRLGVQPGFSARAPTPPAGSPPSIGIAATRSKRRHRGLLPSSGSATDSPAGHRQAKAIPRALAASRRSNAFSTWPRCRCRLQPACPAAPAPDGHAPQESPASNRPRPHSAAATRAAPARPLCPLSSAPADGSSRRLSSGASIEIPDTTRNATEKSDSTGA